ncbi:MAG TPA: hypothetical protein VGM06_10960 [Polyangiaceae bacterium]|jgi:hypothetical protein
MSARHGRHPVTGDVRTPGPVVPDAHGNRKARRAAEAEARKAPLSIFDPKHARHAESPDA